MKYKAFIALLWGGIALSACQTTSAPKAAVSPTPGCKFNNMQWKNGSLVVNAAAKNTQQLYLFHSLLTKSKLMLNHTIPFPSASAGWTSELKPDHWTAFTADKRNFELSCYQTMNKKLQAVDCREVLQVCQMANAHVAIGAEGSYWLVENSPDYPSLMDAIRLHGVYW